jgi:hypothetical protein
MGNFAQGTVAGAGTAGGELSSSPVKQFDRSNSRRSAGENTQTSAGRREFAFKNGKADRVTVLFPNFQFQFSNFRFKLSQA